MWGMGRGGFEIESNLLQYIHKLAALKKFYDFNSGPVYLEKLRNSRDA